MKISWNYSDNGYIESKGNCRLLSATSHKHTCSHWAFILRISGKEKILTLPHPSNNPDLGPYDFYLFLKLKSKLDVWDYGAIEDIQKTNELSTLTENDFHYMYRKMIKCKVQRWNHTVILQGHTLKKITSNFRWIPVSYTHLDVYKRQAVWSGIDPIVDA